MRGLLLFRWQVVGLWMEDTLSSYFVLCGKSLTPLFHLINKSG
nr:MAG TPA: hypothetical protein [Caudoviricetes sp.]